MIKKIIFDMDGTIADLYAVNGWLEMLRHFDETPYAVAKPMVNMSRLARALNKAQRKGYVIGIVSLTSKVSNDDYDYRIAKAKKMWLHNHLPSVHFDEIVIAPYSSVKDDLVDNSENAILFDDEERHLSKWSGIGYTPDKIFEVLSGLE